MDIAFLSWMPIVLLYELEYMSWLSGVYLGELERMSRAKDASRTGLPPKPTEAAWSRMDPCEGGRNLHFPPRACQQVPSD